MFTTGGESRYRRSEAKRGATRSQAKAKAFQVSRTCPLYLIPQSTTLQPNHLQRSHMHAPTRRGRDDNICDSCVVAVRKYASHSRLASIHLRPRNRRSREHVLQHVALANTLETKSTNSQNISERNGTFWAYRKHISHRGEVKSHVTSGRR